MKPDPSSKVNIKPFTKCETVEAINKLKLRAPSPWDQQQTTKLICCFLLSREGADTVLKTNQLCSLICLFLSPELLPSHKSLRSESENALACSPCITCSPQSFMWVIVLTLCKTVLRGVSHTQHLCSQSGPLKIRGSSSTNRRRSQEGRGGSDLDIPFDQGQMPGIS